MTPTNGSDEVAIEQKVSKRAAWILRQQREFQPYPAASPPPRRYVSGEGYCYLGHQHRLKVVGFEEESHRFNSFKTGQKLVFNELDTAYLTVHQTHLDTMRVKS
jgi:hypothetical protein